MEGAFPPSNKGVFGLVILLIISHLVVGVVAYMYGSMKMKQDIYKELLKVLDGVETKIKKQEVEEDEKS